MSFLGLENLHVFVTGAAGGIGSEVVDEFLKQGCRVTAHDRRPIKRSPIPNLYSVQGDISDETSIRSCMTDASDRFGPINILVANAGITDESQEYPIWDTPLDLWTKTYDVNIRGTFLTIKHFLRAAQKSQQEMGKELENLAIVVTGSETGKFGQAGHTEYASGKAGLQYGLVRGVKNEIVRLNSNARINAVAPGWVDTPLIEGRLDDPKEMWAEAQATVPLRKIATPRDVACTMAFLASHRAAGHITGQCISVDGGMEGRVVWKEAEVSTVPAEKTSSFLHQPETDTAFSTVFVAPSRPAKRQIKVALSVDFDALSAWLGTGIHPDNNMADYSAGIFSGKVGVPRLVKLFKKLGIADKMTWFVPGHSMETFPKETKLIVDSGCELALHGYSHEGAMQMTVEQEKDVILKCIDLATKLTGKKPVGWRAPLYQIRESTFRLLEENGFLYDSSLSSHDSEAYFAPRNPPIAPPNFSEPASSWMRPATINEHSKTLVEIPCNWYMEDATPMSYYPHAANSHGYVDARQIEQMWKDRFDWLLENERDTWNESQTSFMVFPLVLHPDTSGMAHIMGMIERFLVWIKNKEEEIVFERYEDIAKAFKQEMEQKQG